MKMPEYVEQMRKALDYNQEEHNRFFFESAFKWSDYWFKDDPTVHKVMNKITLTNQFWVFWQKSFSDFDRAFIQLLFDNRDNEIYQDLQRMRLYYEREHSRLDVFPGTVLIHETVIEYNKVKPEDRIKRAETRSTKFKLSELVIKAHDAHLEGKALRMVENGAIVVNAANTPITKK